MPALSTNAVKKVSVLARIKQYPSDLFVTKYQGELAEILEYVNELDAVDVSGVDYFAGSKTILISQLREDEPDQSDLYQTIRSNIITNFPKRQGNLLVIPNIFA